jgi:20S proteasome alpha/beta subunit
VDVRVLDQPPRGGAANHPGNTSQAKRPKKIEWAGSEAADAMAEAYSEQLQKEFVSAYLSKYGYKTIKQFREEGRDNLGEHFTEICIELDRFDLQTSFLLFGHDSQKHAKLFEIDGPGHVIDHNALKFAVIGSGHDMAMASLRWPPPLKFYLEDTIYRLLEAKFSAETASGVGKTTTVVLRHREGHVRTLSRDDIEKVRNIWKREVADVPSPESAITVLENSLAVTDVRGDS